jgi:iron complex outermembrane receptor protein
LAGNYNQTAISGVAPVPAVLLAANPNATFFTYQTQYNFSHSVPQEKIALTANWTLDAFGVTLRETYWGPQHGLTSPNSGGELIQANQAGVGLTDLELRYSVTDELQFAFGGNNLFNLRPDVTGFAPASCATAGVSIVAGGSCARGPDMASGQSQPANNGNINYAPLTTAWNMNGGYYYARLSFNF